MSKVIVNIRPAPTVPKLPPETPPHITQFYESVRLWCRDAERAVRAVVDAHNALLEQVNNSP